MTRAELEALLEKGYKPGPPCPKCKVQHLRRKLKRSDGYEVETDKCGYRGTIPSPETRSEKVDKGDVST